MTPDEVSMLDALRSCSFLPGSYDKRFVRSLWEMLAWENPPNRVKVLTENQHNYLVALSHKYRKQHLYHEPAECPVCQEIKRKMLDAEKEKLRKWSEGQ